MENQNELRLKFDSFVNQNIASILTHSQNMDPHPVNREALEVWRGQMIENIGLNENFTQKDKINLIEWTNRFADNLTCVSHKEFMQTFNTIIDDLISELIKEKYTNVILCMEEKANKSSIWLAILSWKKLREHVTHVMSVKDANSYLKRGEENSCVIFPDDAAYSGGQYSESYETIHNRVKVRRHFILIPYISEIARDKFESLGKIIWISQNSKSFKSLYSDDETELQKMNNQRFAQVFFGGFSLHGIPDRHVLYFDHKLADRVSIYTQIIAYSPVIPPNGLDFEQIKIGNGFVTGCSRTFKHKSIENLLLDGISADREFPLCPRPVYKYLTYTFNDKEVGKEDNLLFFIKINNYMCYSCNREAKYVCSKCLNQVFCGKKCQINCFLF
jgi:hypothetical protein